MQNTNLNLKVNRYTSQVLGVIKEKFDLKDKSQALEKFADIYGEEFVDREVKDEVVLESIKAVEEHYKKYGYRKRSLEELKNACRDE